jgi:riboflavin kinase/FMN adenylyltransferase
MKRKTVIAIGNFDGVHRGHQNLFRQAGALANKHDFDFAVLTFSPHPLRVFQPHRQNFIITPEPIKGSLINDIAKPDIYHSLDFNDDLRLMAAQDFIDKILINDLNAGVVIVGPDFHFGHKRGGDIDLLKAQNDFETIAAPLLEGGTQPISSTRIREHLKQAEITQANDLLGHEWFIENEVLHGDKRGRALGYPTANMHFGEVIIPAHGIYAVKVQIEGEQIWRQGAANIGIRPMFETAVPMLETYIFDFDGDLYGQNLKVKPVQKIRDEMKFDNLEDLKTQMAKDCDDARALL